jgi:hypothetical protein
MIPKARYAITIKLSRYTIMAHTEEEHRRPNLYQNSPKHELAYRSRIDKTEGKWMKAYTIIKSQPTPWKLIKNYSSSSKPVEYNIYNQSNENSFIQC